MFMFGVAGQGLVLCQVLQAEFILLQGVTKCIALWQPINFDWSVIARQHFHICVLCAKMKVQCDVLGMFVLEPFKEMPKRVVRLNFWILTNFLLPQFY